MWASIMNFVAPEPTPEENLISSIQHGRVDGIQDWLSNRGVDAVEAVKFGESEMNVLQVACFYGNVDAVLKLLEYLPIDSRTKGGGNTCAHLAAMNGHASIVDLLIQRGASPGVKNAKGQNVFDVAQGLQLRQTLMTLVLAEEQRTGTAPVIAGVTRDMTRENERLKNLPPPPTMFGPPATTFQQGPPPNMVTSRPILPDGFVTTVGNPNLAAKYGNQTQNRLEASADQQQKPMAWTAPTIQSAPPVNAASRYVVNSPGFNVLPTTQRQQTQPMMYRPPSGPYANKVKVFNPGETVSSSAMPASTTMPPLPQHGAQEEITQHPSPFQQQ